METRPLLIRDAEAADLPQITSIYAHYVLTHTATFEIDPPDETEMQRRWRSIREHNLPFLVAVREARVVGYCYASSYRPRPAYRYTVEDSVYVAHDAPRLGVGRALLTQTIERCRALGLREMIAIIGDSANTPSIGLHATLGFAHVGVLRNVGYKFERWLDTVIMQLRLVD